MALLLTLSKSEVSMQLPNLIIVNLQTQKQNSRQIDRFEDTVLIRSQTNLSSIMINFFLDLIWLLLQLLVCISFQLILSLLQFQQMNTNSLNKFPRDYLGPVNTNVTVQNDQPSVRQASRQKDNPVSMAKDSQTKIQNLYLIIESLRNENETMNAMVKMKNQEIANLKSQQKGLPSQDQKCNREKYYLNTFCIPSGDLTSPNIVSTELDKAIYQLRITAKERDDVKKYCEQLQQNLKSLNGTPITKSESSKMMVPQTVQSQDVISKQEHAKVIQQYEDHIASLASKISTIHKLEMDVSQLTQERNLIIHDFEGMRNELQNRIGYCEHLQHEIRQMEQSFRQKQVIAGVPPQEYDNKINQVNFLESEIKRLEKLVAERDDKINELQLNKSNYVQLSKQAFQSMQANIASLQQKLQQTTETLRKQTDKASNSQGELNKLNKQLTEKARKLENETEHAKKLTDENRQLNVKFNNAKAEIKQIERSFQEKNAQLEKLKTENEKNKKNSGMLAQLSAEIESYKRKAAESTELAKKLTQQISKIESSYKSIKRQSQKAQEHVKESKSKWELYDKSLKKHSQNMLKVNETCSKRLDEIDTNIQKNMNLQAKLRELVRQNDSLTDEIEQYIKENHYVKASQ